MRDAPAGAFYVWCNRDLGYPRALAQHLGRWDISIVSPGWYERVRRWPGSLPEGTEVIFDHAFSIPGKLSVQAPNGGE